MIPELGLFFLTAAAAAALVTAVFCFYGVAKGNVFARDFWRAGLTSAVISFFAASICLTVSFLTDDFSVAYVAQNSNSALAPVYKFAAFWGSHEGSFLLWIDMIAAAAATALFCAPKDALLKAATAAVSSAVLAAFSLFSLFTSNPFARLLPLVPKEGRDLNPILQDVGMIVHPPLLFAGYAGLTIVFAVVAALLMTGSADAARRRFLRGLVFVTWAFLTAGNALGSWWAYTELGWGGWWFWDPVENASFILWLVTTAMLHAFVLQKTGTFRLTVFLALISFALCLFGSFMVRSGIVQSVHAFAADPARGAALLILSVVLLVPAFVLYAARIEGLTKHEAEAQGSPGGVFYFTVTAGIYLTIAAAASVLIGTLYPLIYDLFALGKISVGAPYFNAFFAPMTIAAAVLIGVVQAAKLPRLFSVCAAVLSLAAAAAIAALFKPSDLVLTVLGFAGAFWVASTALGAAAKRSISAAAVIAHLGLAVSMAGATGTSNYETENLLRMGPGLGKPIADLIFVYDETKDVVTRSYRAKEAQILVMNEKEEVQFTLRPQRQTFTTNGMEMTAAGIRHGLWRDIYVSLGNELGNGEYLVRISIKPLVSWLWAGALLMLLSLPLAYIGRRRKETQK